MTERMEAPRDLRRMARSAARAVVSAGAERYRRGAMLPRLIPVGPEAIADDTAAGRRRILGLLARALRAERSRGRAGHWTYSLDRHVGLLQAFRAERAALRQSGRQNQSNGRGPVDGQGARGSCGPSLERPTRCFSPGS
jgi:hypothetical protein